MNTLPIPDTRPKSAALTIQCSKGCGQIVTIDRNAFVRVRILELDGIYESGIACPNCGTFYVAAWDSDTLIAQRNAIRQARGVYRNLLIRAYQVDFKKLQADMEERARRLREEQEQQEKENATPL